MCCSCCFRVYYTLSPRRFRHAHLEQGQNKSRELAITPLHRCSYDLEASTALLQFLLRLTAVWSTFFFGGGGGGGWSGGAMVLGKLPVPGRPTIWITVGQGPTALTVGAGGGGLDIFILIYPFFLFLPLFGRRPDID